MATTNEVKVCKECLTDLTNYPGKICPRCKTPRVHTEPRNNTSYDIPIYLSASRNRKKDDLNKEIKRLSREGNTKKINAISAKKDMIDLEYAEALRSFSGVNCLDAGTDFLSIIESLPYLSVSLQEKKQILSIGKLIGQVSSSMMDTIPRTEKFSPYSTATPGPDNPFTDLKNE